jgi:hypothetical protein
MTAPTEDQIQAWMRADGQRLADAALSQAHGDIGIALGIVGVAVSRILRTAAPSQRSAMLRVWLDSFRRDA